MEFLIGKPSSSSSGKNLSLTSSEHFHFLNHRKVSIQATEVSYMFVCHNDSKYWKEKNNSKQLCVIMQQERRIVGIKLEVLIRVFCSFFHFNSKMFFFFFNSILLNVILAQFFGCGDVLWMFFALINIFKPSLSTFAEIHLMRTQIFNHLLLL